MVKRVGVCIVIGVVFVWGVLGFVGCGMEMSFGEIGVGIEVGIVGDMVIVGDMFISGDMVIGGDILSGGDIIMDMIGGGDIGGGDM